MAATGPSLVDMPDDILKEIVEYVARLSVTNRGANNEICSLSLVNKRFYDLAILHIFRVIRIGEWEHFVTEDYIALLPAALQHTKYLSLGFPPESALTVQQRTGFPESRAQAALNFLATLGNAQNAQVVSIHAPDDIVEMMVIVADCVKNFFNNLMTFPNVVELHYHSACGKKYLDSGVPKLFPNLTTLVGLGLECYEDESTLDDVTIPFLSKVLDQNEHLKHLQLHNAWRPELLARLVRMGPRLETIVMSWSSIPNGSLYYYASDNIAVNIIRLQRSLEESKGLRNITLPTNTSPEYHEGFSKLLEMIRVHCPHIEMVAADWENHFELWRRSSNFQVPDFVQKVRTTAGRLYHNHRSILWMRYLEPVAPHQKVILTSDRRVSVIDVNPILETEVVGGDHWESESDLSSDEETDSDDSDDFSDESSDSEDYEDFYDCEGSEDSEEYEDADDFEHSEDSDGSDSTEE